MFGESESESPRVPSPWDSLISTPPTPPRHKENLQGNFPKLVPEAEEGNVEYKLQLISPSPARFTRLVTQLKWRLLEGGGQAYYELGVADSGALIGLPRAQLEETLETLEMMAGEIGASVVVVKEIEVPLELVGSNSSPPDRRGTRDKVARELMMLSNDDDSTSTSATDGEFVHGSWAGSSSTSVTSVVERSIDVELEKEKEILEGTGELAWRTLSVNLEISTVYKPRPMRRRAHPTLQASQTKYDKRAKGSKTKKLPHPQHKHPPPHPPEPNESSPNTNSNQHQPPKGRNRRSARDRGRDAKRQALLTQVPTESGITGEETRAAAHIDEISAELVAGLGSLHVTVVAPSLSSAGRSDPFESVRNKLAMDPLTLSPDREDESLVNATGEPRLIVEALVVRKLSLEEAFLDFGGFSLI